VEVPVNDLSTDARALIEANRAGDDPDARDKARVRARLIQQLGVGAFAGAAVLTVVSGAGGSPVSGTAAVAPVVTRVGTALWVKTLGTAAAVAAAAGALYSGTALLDRPQRPRPSDRTSVPATPLPGRPEPEPTVEQLVAEPAVAIAPLHAVSPTNDARKPRTERRGGHARAVAAPPAPTSAPAPVSETTIADELALLAKAQRALRDGRASAALGLVQQHALRFPEGALQEERDGIEVLAHCMLGDAQARAAARAFLVEAPASPLAARVRKECAEE
jgi:hypothetical protein